MSFITIPLQHTGMVSHHRFTPPRDGKTVHFQLPGYLISDFDIYLQIDKRFQPKPFENNTSMTTNVGFTEVFHPKAHDADVILVSKAEIQLETMELSVASLTLSHNGFQVTANFQSSLRAKVKCTDTRYLAKAYLDGKKDPLKEIQDELTGQFLETANSILSREEKDNLLTPSNINNRLFDLIQDIKTEAIQRITRKNHWFAIVSYSFSLTIINPDALLKPVNDEAQTLENERQAAFKLAIDLLGRPLLTPELAGLIHDYMDAQPQAPKAKQIIQFVEEMRPLLQMYPASLIEQLLAKELGLKGIKRSVNRGDLLL